MERPWWLRNLTPIRFYMQLSTSYQCCHQIPTPTGFFQFIRKQFTYLSNANYLKREYKHLVQKYFLQMTLKGSIYLWISLYLTCFLCSHQCVFIFKLQKKRQKGPIEVKQHLSMFSRVYFEGIIIYVGFSYIFN